jgi:hypothetical protein
MVKRSTRRTVRLTGLSGRRGPTKLWAYGYGDYARLLGVSAEYIRVLVSRGAFDPGDLESLFRYWVGRREKD